ncbi:MAG: aminopeptidase [Lachnospiraceae bacterium]|nr:aminopeptidase [Lachnospiraceae bacterium]
MVMERYRLSTDRISEILTEQKTEAPFATYFSKVASFIGLLNETYETVADGSLYRMDLAELQRQNHTLYEDILPGNYGQSFANPTYAVSFFEKAGYAADYGQILCFLYTEIRGLIPYVFEKDLSVIVLFLELFIEIYDQFALSDAGVPKAEELKKTIYWFESDNCDILIPNRLSQQIDPAYDFPLQIIKDNDLGDLRYLYYYGDYVSENELGLAKLFAKMPEEEVARLASVYTEGYRIGFVNAGKDLSKKETAEVRYPLGLERMVLQSVPLFEKMGLKVTVRRNPTLSVIRVAGYRAGVGSTSPNRQYDFDHKEDAALFLDKDFVNRKVSVLKAAFEERRSLANHHAGPAVIETFGEEPFDPVFKKEALRLDAKQQKLSVEYADESGRLINEYIIGSERSFTIISFPVPAIGKDFEKIFEQTVVVNTLDYKLYEHMQQIIIDTLDKARYVHVVGSGKNHTDITVALYELKDPAKETIFENCVADVNIPVGEVFTSPKLTGTNGVLHVTEVYLAGLKYTDLSITFKDGCIADYTCGNFETEEENRKYIKDNVMFHHDMLPLGEFAIGTNTTAYRMAKDFGIFDRLDILIAEKTGPHFAVGDTCYSYDEDLETFNPDGKQIVARDNEITIKRKDNPKEAYFHCHTDITIPYDELAGIYAVDENGNETAIIRDGLFVLPGLDALNQPLLAKGR